jgi:hypothetical protein
MCAVLNWIVLRPTIEYLTNVVQWATLTSAPTPSRDARQDLQIDLELLNRPRFLSHSQQHQIHIRYRRH